MMREAVHNEASLRYLSVPAVGLIVSPTFPGLPARLRSLCGNLDEEAFLDSRLPKLIFTLLALYAAVHFSDLYAQLPNVVASHFNARGAANGWQTKQAFFQVLVGMGVLAAVLGFAIPQIIVRVPVQFINLPNKDYWLATEHREETLEWLKAYFGWFACALYLLMIVVYDYAAQSNLHPDHPPGGARLLYTLVGFLTFVIAWLVRMFRRFAHVPNTPGYGAR